MEEVSSKSMHHRSFYHVEFLELIFPFLCALITVVCSLITLLGPDRYNTHNADGFMFRHRTPLWLMQVSLVILRIFLAFAMKDLYAWNIVLPISVLVAVILDNRNIAESAIKVRCWLFLYSLVLFYALKELLMDTSNPLKILSFINALVVVALSIIRSLFTFEERHSRPPTDEYTSNLLIYTTFSFLNIPIMYPAFRKGSLDTSDIPDLTDYDSSEYLWDCFCRRRRKESSLLVNVLRVVYSSYLSQGLYAFFSSVLLFIAPLALERILWHISKEGGGESLSYLPFSVECALVLLMAGPMLSGIADNLNYNHGRHVGIQSRAILQCLLYQKLLKLDTTAVPDGAGRIANLVSTDLMYILSFACYSHHLWTLLLQITLCVYLLLQTLGIAALGGVAVMVLAVPVGSFISETLRNLYKILNKATDVRMGVINEILQGIRIIKLFGWENQIMRKLADARKDEVLKLKSCTYTSACLDSLWAMVLPLVAVVSFVIHTSKLHRELTPAMGFTALTLFNILRFPLQSWPSIINNYVRANISLRRIELFLESPEVRGSHSIRNGDDCKPPHDVVLRMEAVELGWRPSTEAAAHDEAKWCYQAHCSTLSWNSASYELVQAEDSLDRDLEQALKISDSSDDIRVVLSGVNLEIARGSLNVIVGMTGSGKSTLIMGILGECIQTKGSIKLSCSRVSYVSQAAFIQSGSLRENILFGEPFDEDRYSTVLRLCALDKDIETLPDGDMCQIGEKGVNLSGGQQQRLNLARAAYSMSEFILLDDPLSAVDSKVGEHIFKTLILGYLKDRTVLFVTNQLALTIPSADTVIYIDPGRNVFQCTPDRLTSVLESSKTNADAASFVEILRGISRLDPDVGRGVASSGATNEVPLEKQGSLNTRDHSVVGLDSIIKEETKAKGIVKLQIYKHYMDAFGGWPVGLGLLGVCIFVTSMDLCQNVFLSKWMNQMETSANASDGSSYLSLYLLFIALAVSADVSKAFIQANVALSAAQHLHNYMTFKILRGTMAWYEGTPLGRILNRFSQDVQTVDCDVMKTLVAFAECSLSTIQIILVISFTLPLILPMLLPVVAICCWVTYQYLVASRELKRLESVNRSPILVHFSESVQGLAIIRAYAHEERFFGTILDRINVFSRMHMYLWASNRWLNQRMCICGSATTALAGLAIVYGFGLNESTAGLALLYSLAFTDNITWIARTHADCQMNLNSVERIKEYSEVPQEKYEGDVAGASLPQSIIEYMKANISEMQVCDETSRDDQSLSSWPSRGKVEFVNICLSYRTNPYVLRDVSFIAVENSKVGIVGRTGAGKSSLIAALFRIVEPTAGRIIIDGVDVLQLPLHSLRSKIAVVPQEPLLFAGTIRSNLDPFNKLSDSDLWDAIRRVKLEAFVSELPGDALDQKVVTEKGANLSVGQRQLLCMARALVKKSKIIVMDEATASVDHETDALIQDTIRNELNATTVLCVAHRLHTIAFYDRVIVMDKGRVAEIGEPLGLMMQATSLFRQMCLSSGDFDNLLKIAKAK